MDAQTLFREGVTAIKDEKDMQKGRDLLMQSLRLNPNNEMAWLWLSRTVSDGEKKRQCIERALAINPSSEQALAMMERLNGTPVPAKKKTATSTHAAVRSTATVPVTSPASSGTKRPDTAAQNRLETYLKKAQDCLEHDDAEGAIENWVHALDIQPDHEEALANAVKHLSRLKYIDDARELVWDALNAGTTHPSIYLTAIDIARFQRNHQEADDLRERLARLPSADAATIISVVDHFTKNSQDDRALVILEEVVQTHSNNQKLILRLADLYKEKSRSQEAVQLYERAARLGSGTSEGKLADERLQDLGASLTDKERGSIGLALREAFGVGVALLLMGWQDAGLDLLKLGTGRLAGVGIGVLGGYLLVTATSSPQQQPLARWLGGEIPPPPERESHSFEDAVEAIEHVSELPMLTLPVRIVLGVIGAALVALAVVMVFNATINLLTNPNPTPITLPTMEELFNEVPE